MGTSKNNSQKDLAVKYHVFKEDSACILSKFPIGKNLSKGIKYEPNVKQQLHGYAKQGQYNLLSI